MICLQIFSPHMAKKFGTQLLTADQYLSLYIPAVDWLLFGTFNYTKCKESLLEDMLNKCETTENR